MRTWMKKHCKKSFIKFIFIIPFITCLYTSISVKTFTDAQIALHPHVFEVVNFDPIFDLVALCLFVNAIANFLALLFYFCLETKSSKKVHK